MSETKLAVTTVVVAALSLLLLRYQDAQKRQLVCDADLWQRHEHHEFEGFDNETGILTGYLIVPNYVHFLRMGASMKNVKFIDAMCMLAAFKKQRPDRLFIHTDQKHFSGFHWDYLMNKVPGFKEALTIVSTQLPDTIFDQKFSQVYHYFHSSDVLRIQVLMKYGGMFLDNDSFLVKSLDPYRKFEMAIGWDEGMFLGTQVLVAHKDARFLRLWLDSYRGHYYPTLWYFNAGEWPTVSILWARPELVHRVKLLFGVHPLIDEVFVSVWPDWRKQFAIHLLTRHLNAMFAACNISFNNESDLTESFVSSYHNTLYDMIGEIYDLKSNFKGQVVEKFNCKP
ncbi:hypothetical protein LSTR_LSTR001898 [Laodelphax striatellus]|uniref:Alpha-1,4-N-acetylglucosaminyltransferase n=1 Tax=Laodelphax striatellus TaxID=195883 RepID=A0A482WG09_LAOST|nr:hypothetical protein LSTR_LSTR001898 [Laodelphax striatellus]